MRIFIMRHGEAEFTATEDQLRKLTPKGIKQANEQGKWLAGQSFVFDKIMVSPYVRAEQTFAEINKFLLHTNPDIIEQWDNLSPYGNAQLVADYIGWLRNSQCKNLLLISHLPLVEEIILELNPNCATVYFHPATMAILEWHKNLYRLLRVKPAEI